jgi:hypothetical protein
MSRCRLHAAALLAPTSAFAQGPEPLREAPSHG